MMSVCTSSNTWIGEEYSLLLIEKINVMLQREESSLNCHDYLNAASCSHQFDAIDEIWRQKTAEWMFKVRERKREWTYCILQLQFSSTINHSHDPTLTLKGNWSLWPWEGHCYRCDDLPRSYAICINVASSTQQEPMPSLVNGLPETSYQSECYWWKHLNLLLRDDH